MGWKIDIKDSTDGTVPYGTVLYGSVLYSLTTVSLLHSMGTSREMLGNCCGVNQMHGGMNARTGVEYVRLCLWEMLGNRCSVSQMHGSMNARTSAQYVRLSSWEMSVIVKYDM
jgi:hypothetical protein